MGVTTALLMAMSGTGVVAIEPTCFVYEAPDFEVCARVDLASANQQIMRYLASANGLASLDERSALASSQELWIRYVEAECDAVGRRSDRTAISDSSALRCLVTATDDRTGRIWDGWISTTDGAAPVLPKPVSSVRPIIIVD